MKTMEGSYRNCIPSGRESGSQYTEDDVRAAARVLTGHTVDSYFNYVFDVAGHDDQNKAFSNFYGSTIITGRSGSARCGRTG